MGSGTYGLTNATDTSWTSAGELGLPCLEGDVSPYCFEVH